MLNADYIKPIHEKSYFYVYKCFLFFLIKPLTINQGIWHPGPTAYLECSLVEPVLSTYIGPWKFSLLKEMLESELSTFFSYGFKL